jgi:Putative lumazine-binding
VAITVDLLNTSMLKSGTKESEMAVADDEDAVRSVVMDYVEGWFEGEAGRMERALHPELVKRCRGIEGEDPDALETLSAQEMIDATADGEGRREDAADRRIEIRIDYLSGGVASVQCFCHRYVDLLHLIDMPDGWKIVNAAWRLR